MTALRLYVREGCHLCEEMLKDLQRVLQNREIQLELIDVDRSPGKLDDYGSRVPVLESAQGACLSEYFLDEVKLINYLDGV
ncbi:MAG: glutaredoxin family protein [Pseudomonadota bacterium]